MRTQRLNSPPKSSWHYNGDPMPKWVSNRFSLRSGGKISTFLRGEVIEAYPGDTLELRGNSSIRVVKGKR